MGRLTHGMLVSLDGYVRGFADAWQATDTVVVSRSLTAVDTARTRLWSELDVPALRALVETAEGDVSISGPTLAAAALRAALVDEVRAHGVPHVVGGGLRFLPEGWSAPLALRSERRFAGGTVELVYDVRRAVAPVSPEDRRGRRER